MRRELRLRPQLHQLLKPLMTRNFTLLPTCFGGLLVLLALAACSNEASNGGGGSSGGAGVETGGAGGRVEAAGAAGDGDGAGDSAGAGAGGAGGAGHPGDAGSAGEPAIAGGGSGAGGSSGAPASAGSSGMAASGGIAGSGGSAGGGGQAQELMIPCDVYAAFQVCRYCHGRPPSVAPMPLLTLLDVQTFAGSAYEAVLTGEMPPEGSLPNEDATLILDWLEDGAEGVPKASCQ